MKKNKKHIWLVVIAILIASLAFGYAYLTTTLSINGITDIDRNSWDVYFDNVQVTTGSVSGAQEIESPTITSDTEVEFHINLKQPGDFYEFTIEARNDGTIDAMINSVSKKLNGTEITTLPAYLKYSVTYEDDIEIENNHLLASETLETYKIRVEYRNDISASDLPSTAQSLSLSFGVEYVQSDDTSEKVRELLYSVSDTNFEIGSAPPTGVTTYDNYQDAINAFGYPFFIRNKIGNHKVLNSDLGFVYEENLYYLAGGIKSAYQDNKQILIDAFGSSQCNEVVNGSYVYTTCTGNSIHATATNNGRVYIHDDNYECRVRIDGTSNCNEPE